MIDFDQDAYLAAAAGRAAVEDFFYSRMVLSEGSRVRCQDPENGNVQVCGQLPCTLLCASCHTCVLAVQCTMPAGATPLAREAPFGAAEAAGRDGGRGTHCGSCGKGVGGGAGWHDQAGGRGPGSPPCPCPPITVLTWCLPYTSTALPPCKSSPCLPQGWCTLANIERFKYLMEKVGLFRRIYSPQLILRLQERAIQATLQQRGQAARVA